MARHALQPRNPEQISWIGTERATPLLPAYRTAPLPHPSPIPLAPESRRSLRSAAQVAAAGLAPVCALRRCCSPGVVLVAKQKGGHRWLCRAHLDELATELRKGKARLRYDAARWRVAQWRRVHAH